MRAGRIAFRSREVVCNDSDNDVLLAEWRRAFPSLRVLPEGISGFSVDLPLGAFQDGMQFALPYRDSLNSPGDHSFSLWIEPDGWLPEWQKVVGYESVCDVVSLRNKPRLSFRYRRSVVDPWTRSSIRGGQLHASYPASDREVVRFLDKVWRIGSSHLSNVHDVFAPNMEEPPRRSVKTVVWSGFHVRTWCTEQPDRRIDGNLRPPTNGAEPERRYAAKEERS
jgi:hypothetical protein